MTTWKGTTSGIRPYTITVERDIYGGFVSSPLREVAPYMNSNESSWAIRQNQESATIGACLSQDIRKGALFNQAMFPAIGKTQAKAHKQVMNVSVLPYNRMRQILSRMLCNWLATSRSV